MIAIPTKRKTPHHLQMEWGNIRFIPVDGKYCISHPISDKEYEITYVHSGFGLEEMFVVLGIKEKSDEFNTERD